jgi:hypothetical protein
VHRFAVGDSEVDLRAAGTEALAGRANIVSATRWSAPMPRMITDSLRHQ